MTPLRPRPSAKRFRAIDPMLTGHSTIPASRGSGSISIRPGEARRSKLQFLAARIAIAGDRPLLLSLLLAAYGSDGRCLRRVGPNHPRVKCEMGCVPSRSANIMSFSDLYRPFRTPATISMSLGRRAIGSACTGRSPVEVRWARCGSGRA